MRRKTLLQKLGVLTVGRYCGPLLWNDQFDAGLDVIRVSHLVFIGFENFHVFVGVAVELLADFGEAVTGLHLVGARRSGAGGGSGGGLRGGRIDLGSQVRKIGSTSLIWSQILSFTAAVGAV